MKRLAPRPRSKGIVLALENWLSAGENIAILERVGSPAVRVYYDVANSQDAGHPILDEIRLLKDRIVEFHAKDTKDLYGKGSMDFPAVREAMEDIGYQGWLIIEGTKMPLGVEASVRYDADYLKTVYSGSRLPDRSSAPGESLEPQDDHPVTTKTRASTSSMKGPSRRNSPESRRAMEIGGTIDVEASQRRPTADDHRRPEDPAESAIAAHQQAATRIAVKAIEVYRTRRRATSGDQAIRLQDE